jgi:shikimate dehydrogenase
MLGAALAATGLSRWRYQLLPVPPPLFAETVLALPGAGFRGANVTIPHKQAALELADERTEVAQAIGAANTLLFEPSGAVLADNTDAPALVQALPAPPQGKSALVLGAGGSARAAVWALLDAGADQVRVWNRHPERARQLAEELGACPATEAKPADLLVNCTPAGMEAEGDQFKQLPLKADELAMFGCVVDFVYGREQTPLVRSASRLGVPVVDGLELLVRQGALSFERFTGCSAPLQTMRAAVRER